jgi:hypothetical protein
MPGSWERSHPYLGRANTSLDDLLWVNRYDKKAGKFVRTLLMVPTPLAQCVHRAEGSLPALSRDPHSVESGLDFHTTINSCIGRLLYVWSRLDDRRSDPTSVNRLTNAGSVNSVRADRAGLETR